MKIELSHLSHFINYYQAVFKQLYLSHYLTDEQFNKGQDALIALLEVHHILDAKITAVGIIDGVFNVDN